MEFLGVDEADGSGGAGTPVAGARLHERRPTAERAGQWAHELRDFVLRLAEEWWTEAMARRG